MSAIESHPAWRAIRARLRDSVPETTWHLWLESLTPRSVGERSVVVEAPTETAEWVRTRFTRLLHETAEAVLGSGARVDLVAPGETSELDAGPAPSEPGPAARSFNPKFTFDQFVIGDANRLAHGAALAVAEMPGLAYNPLFICGPPGLGKTHLLHSIANYVTAYGAGLTVRYTTAEAFTDDYIRATRGGDVNAFKSAYRDVDVLLVDDVQFLQSRVKTEQEFFHTFNALHAAGAQIVLTSDKPPRDLDALEDRLRQRFEAGLVTEVRSPDFRTRLTILRKRAIEDRVRDLGNGTLELIAERVPASVRGLEAALIRVVAFSSLTGRKPDVDLAAEVLDGLYPETRVRRRSVRDIQERVAADFGVSVEALLSESRAANVAWPRQVAMYLARELTDQTLPAIGREFGGRNHTTVLHACKRTQERIASDAAAFEAVSRLSAQLSGDADDRTA